MDPNLIDLLARSPGVAFFAADIAIKATLVLAAAGAVAMALRRSSAAARHLAWCLGLGAALALPALSLILPGWSWRVLPADAEPGRPNRSTAAESAAPHAARSGTAPQSLDEIAFQAEEEALRNDGPAGRLPARPTTPPTTTTTTG